MEEDTAIINQEERPRAISALMYKLRVLCNIQQSRELYILIQRQGWPFRVYAGLENPVHSICQRIYDITSL